VKDIRPEREARSPVRRILVPILAALLVAAACGGEEPRRRVNRPQQPGTIEIGGEAARDHGMVTVTSPQQPLSVTAGEFYFEPTLLAGSPGLEIQVQVAAAAGTAHSFTLPEQQVDAEIAGSASAPITVRFPDSGIVRFYCRYHRDRGMVGGLVAA
jgi:plastocyanin